MEFEKILQLIESVSNSELTCFTLEEGGMKLVLEARRGYDVPAAREVVATVNETQVKTEVKPVKAEAVQEKKAPQATAATVSGNVVKSPLVGTFYSAPAPDAPAFVKVGDTVEKGQTLGIVEAMKLMNEIECEFDGVVKEILIDNASVVEYGQPLFVIG